MTSYKSHSKHVPWSIGALAVALVLLFAAPAAAQSYWGAIAVDPETGAVGTSFDFPTAAAAQRQAKADCGTPHCKAAVWVTNGWAALVQKSNGVYVPGLGRTKAIAFANARQRAHESSARTITSVFSG